MRFHVIGISHAKTTKEYSADAFTQKVRLICKMLTEAGHEVYHYGTEGSTPICTEHIDVLSKETFDRVHGAYDWKKGAFLTDSDNPANVEFVKNAIIEVNKRRQPKDFLLCSFGYQHKPIADAAKDMIIVELGIGYRWSFAPHRVFESYSWMNFIYGTEGKDLNPNFYDAVIPNYYDLDDYIYSDQKEDYFFFIARPTILKGLEIAVKSVEAVGGRLVVAGQGEPPVQSPVIDFVGVVSIAERAKWLSKAKASFTPTYYIEPFGGTVVESMLCVLPDEIVLGENKLIKDYKVGDTVYLDAGIGKVNKVFERDYSGNICEIKSCMCLPLSVTDEHPLLVADVERKYSSELRKLKKFTYKKVVKELKWVTANNLKENDYIVFPKYTKEIEIGNINLSKYIRVDTSKKRDKVSNIQMDIDLMWLLGIYVAEGNLIRKDCWGGVAFSFHKNEIALIERVKKIYFDKFGYKPHQLSCKDSNGIQLYFGGCSFARFLEENFRRGACNKVIPQWIIDAPKELLKAFLIGYIDGDGCFTRNELSISTSSKILSLQIQKVFTKFGVLASITQDKREGDIFIQGRKCHIQDRYIIRLRQYEIFNDAVRFKNYIPGNRIIKRYLEDGNNFYVPIKKIDKKHYSGKVYNLNTTNGTYQISNVVVHNCGTPVIAADFGAFPETVVHGKVGYRARTLEQFIWATQNIGNIKPADCRKWAEDNYKLERVREMYEEYFDMLHKLYTDSTGWYQRNPDRTNLDWLNKKY